MRTVTLPSFSFRPPVQGGPPADSQRSDPNDESVRERPAKPATTGSAPWNVEKEPEAEERLLRPIDGGGVVVGLVDVVARFLPDGRMLSWTCMFRVNGCGCKKRG